MKKKKILFSFTALLVSAALCACSGGKSSEETNTSSDDTQTSEESSAETSTADSTESSDDSEIVYGGSVVFGLTQDLVSLDPHQTTDAGTRSVVFNIYEGLVKSNSDGELEPAIAESYTISDDATVYTFALRDGVLFHDGSEVTAEDVKYSIERYAEIQGEDSAFSMLVDSVEIEDENTIVISLVEGNSEFLADLELVAIIPEANDDPEGNPIGTGPFQFVSYTAGQELVLEKNENYWQEGLPYLDGCTFKIVADIDTAFTQLQAGTIDILNYMTSDQVETLQQTAADDFDIVESTMNLVQALYLNNDYEPLSDVRVRQALCYAINREEVIAFSSDGNGHVLGSHMIPSLTTWYEESCETVYEYDVEKALELLAEAGYEDGFDLEITVPSSYTQHVDTAQVVAEQLSAIGINVTITQVEWSTWLEEVYQNRDYQATVIGFDGTLAPSDWLEKYTTDADNNMTNYSNEEYDELFELAYAAVDTEEKAAYYKEMQLNLAENAASVYLQDPADYIAVNSDYTGYVCYPTSAYDLSLVHLKAEQ